MAEVVLERRAALRSNGEKIREVVRLKELQHHFISYRSKVFWNHFHFLRGIFWEEKSLTLFRWRLQLMLLRILLGNSINLKLEL